MLKAITIFAAAFALSCSPDAPPTSPEQSPIGLDGHTITRFADHCVFEDFFVGVAPSAKSLATHNWARDRYDEGLVIDYLFQDSYDQYATDSPVMRQALSLAADTLYAAFLPTKGLDTLQVRVLVKRLDSEFTLARAGGNFHGIGQRKGLPQSGDVRIEINENIFHDPNEADHPRYVSAMADWYLLFLHEMFHVLGFGLSPRWNDLKGKEKARLLRLRPGTLGSRRLWPRPHGDGSRDISEASRTIPILIEPQRGGIVD